ncbi:hypothetical protein CC80DRAFT_508251 [Byssothecium circinans]|uniref:C2H2-type domain-containing protein n=1 Tax=Byssothecium circinans TaxID=147558 RepID=A0A6A5TH76_9PLEO|nr:hypothetical protein CC80DRAFT_508251 [Byssothecium circinans]
MIVISSPPLSSVTNCSEFWASRCDCLLALLHLQPMQASTDAAASSTNSESALCSSLGHTLCLHRITPQDVDSASTGRPGDASLCYSETTADGKEVAKPLQSAEPSNDAFTSVTDLFWDDAQHVYESPPETLNFESFGNLCLDTSFLGSFPDVPLLSEWNTPWLLDLGSTEQSTFSDLPVLPDQYLNFISPACTEYGREKELSAWSFEPTSPMYTAEPVSPTSLPSIASVYASDRRRRDSISSRGSRSTSQISSRTCISEPHKLRIDPLKHTKSSSREPGDSFSCDLCERTFRYKKDVERHKTSVHEKRPSWFCPTIQCKFSTRGFSRKDKAFQHVKTHRSNSDASLEPICAAEKAKLRSVGSAPVSPHPQSTTLLHHNPFGLGRNRKTDIDTIPVCNSAYITKEKPERERRPRRSREEDQAYVNID